MSIALLPRYAVSTDGITLTVTDRTGQYSTLIPGGWDPTGAANPKVIEATVAEIRIAKRNPDGTFGAETTVNVYDDLPSDDGGDIDITSTDAGQGGNFVDCVYRMTYMVQGIWTSNADTPFLVTDVRYIPIIPSICTCWQKASADFAKCQCNCDGLNDRLSKISLYMRLLDASYQCGNLNAMQQNIDILTKLCADCGCGCD